MPTGDPIEIPIPLSSFPGANPQEGGGRLINCSAEPLAEAQRPSAPAPQVWRRQPGLSIHASTGIATPANYRGGILQTLSLAYEIINNNMLTVDNTGAVTVTPTGTLNIAGTRKLSFAINQKTTPDVVAVDLDNGGYILTAGTVWGSLPEQPKAVTFQDGYFFLLMGDGKIYASGINATTVNSLTFTTMQAKQPVIPMRVIAFSGLVWAFSSAHCERYQDVATPAPAFPYSRLDVLEWGLAQENAIAGFETGFSVLTWVAQDFGVWQVQPQQSVPTKVSPPDLDKLIERQIMLGNLLEASVYITGGKKFWVLSSPSWTWEFNLSTQKWNERWSLSGGIYSRWRGTLGHPAFGKWLMGDQQTTNLLYVDPANYTEAGAPQLFRVESGSVNAFPNQIRIARADFYFDMGVGQVAGTVQMVVVGASAGTAGVIRLQILQIPAGVAINDVVYITGISGTTEANGNQMISALNTATYPFWIELAGTSFVHVYINGGVVTDNSIIPPNNVQNPVAAVSCSKDGGVSFDVPSIRSLAPQGKTKRYRVSVKNRGVTSAQGDRWRLDVTDPVYTALMKGTQSSDPREVGA
jgi:hypothetical protein